MENQHRKITGYRELSEFEIGLLNDIKTKAEEVGALVDRLDSLYYTVPEPGDAITNVKISDGRWLAIGRTQLQQGFMALTRAIAKPTTF